MVSHKKRGGKLEKSNVSSGSRRVTSDKALPSLQKIKASLRQTRRLLRKDSLAADVRIQAERRLETLQTELQVAEVKHKERSLAKRYHMVKFFERQKIMRRIMQKKKQMASVKDSKERLTDIENELFELRVDLNYILHYPKSEKYISLLASRDGDSLISEITSEATNSKTNSRKEELRAWIRSKMQQGEFSLKPETEVQASRREESNASSYVQKSKPGNAMAKVKPQIVQRAEITLRDDDFFEIDEASRSDLEASDSASDGS